MTKMRLEVIKYREAQFRDGTKRTIIDGEKEGIAIKGGIKMIRIKVKHGIDKDNHERIKNKLRRKLGIKASI